MLIIATQNKLLALGVVENSAKAGYLYLKFIRDGVAPIETLSLEKKEKYWDIALRYYTDKEQRIKAMKAAYTLSLITSND